MTIEEICDTIGVAPSIVTGRDRRLYNVLIREIVANILRRVLKMKTEEVGKMMGGRDHSTIVHTLERYDADYSVDKDFREMADEMTGKFKTKYADYIDRPFHEGDSVWTAHWDGKRFVSAPYTYGHPEDGLDICVVRTKKECDRICKKLNKYRREVK